MKKIILIVALCLCPLISLTAQMHRFGFKGSLMANRPEFFFKSYGVAGDLGIAYRYRAEPVTTAFDFIYDVGVSVQMTHGLFDGNYYASDRRMPMGYIACTVDLPVTAGISIVLPNDATSFALRGGLFGSVPFKGVFKVYHDGRPFTYNLLDDEQNLPTTLFYDSDGSAVKSNYAEKWSVGTVAALDFMPNRRWQFSVEWRQYVTAFTKVEDAASLRPSLLGLSVYYWL